PVYVGDALLIVDPQHNRVLNEQNNPAVLSNMPSDPASIESQVQMLESHALASQVVDKLNLTADPEFGGVNARATPDSGSIRGLLASLIASLGLSFGGSDRASPKPDTASAVNDSVRRREAVISQFHSHLDVHQAGLSTVIEV